MWAFPCNLLLYLTGSILALFLLLFLLLAFCQIRSYCYFRKVLLLTAMTQSVESSIVLIQDLYRPIYHKTELNVYPLYDDQIDLFTTKILKYSESFPIFGKTLKNVRLIHGRIVNSPSTKRKYNRNTH